ncbi:MAG TPA: hypothetical protein VM890_12845 [Longimicrobium sp.]|nr:hypothetical protein [Longimicrobium sp.]
MTIAEDPLEVARAAFAAVDARDWRALLAHVDPAALAAVKQQAISVAEGVSTRNPSTTAEIQARQPELPLAVAEWYAEQERLALAAEEPAGITSLGVTSMDELRALPDDEVFVRWLTATDVAERRRRIHAQLHGVALEEAEAFPAPPRRRRVVGCVVEDGSAHVLYRDLDRGSAVQVESLASTDRGWRLTAAGVVSASLRTYFRM